MRSIAILVASLLLTGCVNPPIAGRADPYQAHQVNFNSADLANKTAVDKPEIHYANEGIMYVSVPIRSTINHNLHVDYRITFFDDHHVPIYQSGWESTQLVANTPSYITFNSTNSNARHFQLDVRWAQ